MSDRPISPVGPYVSPELLLPAVEPTAVAQRRAGGAGEPTGACQLRTGLDRLPHPGPSHRLPNSFVSLHWPLDGELVDGSPRPHRVVLLGPLSEGPAT